MSRHLSANDYYSEGETVEGYWRGKAAKMLGIEGELVTKEAFDALRMNKHPLSGEKLRPRISKVAFHDMVFSAPKSFSIAAMVGEDERLIKAFHEVTERTLKRLEAHAGMRDRQGRAYNTEAIITTGNGVVAVYHHDTSRLLEPQVHAHMVFSNHTWSEQHDSWFALQPRAMLETSKSTIREQCHRDLARECQKLGYEVQWRDGTFRLTGISPQLEKRFSVRTQQREDFAKRYKELFGSEPDKRRIEQFIKDTKNPAVKRFVSEYEQVFGQKPAKELIGSFVKDWRSDKMATSSKEQVHREQLARMKPEEAQELRSLVVQTRESVANRQHGPNAHVDTPRLSMPPLQPTMSEPHRQSPKQKSRGRGSGHNQALATAEAIRKLKRGALVIRALNGSPVGLINHVITQAARRKQ